MKARVPTLPTPTTLRATSIDLEALQQVAVIVSQGGPVGAELLVDHVLDLVAPSSRSVAGMSRNGMIDRWLADDPVPAVDVLGQLRERLDAVAGAGLLGDLLRGLLDGLGLLLVRPLHGAGRGVDGIEDVLRGDP